MQTTDTSHQPSVLIVENEAPVALSEQRLLEAAGYRVVVAATGAEAVEIAGSDREIDIVLADIGLDSQPDGIEAAAQILDIRPVAIIFLTAHNAPDIVERAAELPFEAYLEKGVAEAVLLASISAAYRRYRARRAQVSTALLDQVPGVIYQYQYYPDGSSRFPFATNNIELVYEVRPSEVVSDASKVFQRLHPDDYDGVVASIIRSRDTMELWEYDYRVVLPSRGIRWLRGRARPEPAAAGSVLWHGYITDISDLMETQQEIGFQRTLLEAVGEAIVAVDADRRITYHNSAAAGLYGFPGGDARRRRLSEVVVPDVEPAAAQAVLGRVASDPHWEGELVVQTGAGVPATVRIANYPVSSDGPDGSRLVSVARRLHFGRPFHETAPEEHYLQRELYRLVQTDPSIFDFLQQGTLDGLWYWDLEQQDQAWMNDRFWELLGVDPATKRPSLEAWQDLIFPEDREKVMAAARRHIDEPSQPVDEIVRYRHSDGHTVYVRCRGIVVRNEYGTPIRMLGAHTDVTELMERLEMEKVLRRELNHRVKNNLAIVRSLISLRQSELGQSVDLSGVMRQVDTIVKVHEAVQHSDSLTMVAARPYLTSVLGAALDPSVDAAVEGDDPAMSSRTAVPLGLIVNELATNAVQHAFVAGEPKRFRVELAVDREAARVIVSVRHTGLRFPEDVDLADSGSMGLRLVTALCRQLRGTIAVERDPVTTFRIEFPLPDR